MFEHFNLYVDFYIKLISIVYELSIAQYTVIGVILVSIYFFMSLVISTSVGDKYGFDFLIVDLKIALVIGILWALIYVIFITLAPTLILVILGVILNHYILKKKNKK